MCQSGVLNVGISDHFITYYTRKVNRALVNKQYLSNAIVLNISGVGVDKLSICWFRSYVTGTVQVTDVYGTMSG